MRLGSSPLHVPQGVPALLRDLVHEHTGIYFEADRFDTLIDKLRPRAVARGCQSFLEYYYILKYDDHGREEWLRVMDAFSVQETYFYREYAQIEALVRHIAPNWFRRTNEPLAVWSAACATGEEPYSLAIALTEAGYGSHPIRIVGSDASEAALARARTAVYRERSFRMFPAHLRLKYFEATPEGTRLRTDLLPNVTFTRANLADEAEVAPLSKVPVIFCRNVFIYFSPQAIQRTAGYFSDGMPDGGHLFIGASESLLKLHTQYELRELGDAFVYVRRPRQGSIAA